MNLVCRLIRVVAYALVGTCAGVVLTVVLAGLLGGLATIPQVDWRHSDAVGDVAANAVMIGLIFGGFLGSPLGAFFGLATGVVVGFRSPASGGAAKRPTRPGRHWLTFGVRLGVPVVALAVGLLVLWEFQRRFERRETALRLRQVASGDAAARRDALGAIRGFGPYAALPVAEALASPDPNLRRAALLGAREVLGVCLEKLGEMNCITGFVPGRTAAVSGFEQLTAALTKALGDPDASLRQEAARVLSLAQKGQPGDAGGG